MLIALGTFGFRTNNALYFPVLFRTNQLFPTWKPAWKRRKNCVRNLKSWNGTSRTRSQNWKIWSPNFKCKWKNFALRTNVKMMKSLPFKKSKRYDDENSIFSVLITLSFHRGHWERDKQLFIENCMLFLDHNTYLYDSHW